MSLRDYFHSESEVYRDLSPEKRVLRVAELWVGVGFGLFAAASILLAFLVKAIHDHKELLGTILDW